MNPWAAWRWIAAGLLVIVGAACSSQPHDDLARRLADSAGPASAAQAPPGPLARFMRMAQPMPAPDVPGSITAGQLFDWAEATFPALFPAGPTTQRSASYRFRYYTANDLYLAVLDGGAILALGTPTGGKVLTLGMLADFAPPVLAWAGAGPFFREVVDALPDPSALFLRTRREAQELGIQVKDAAGLGMVMTIDLDGDGRKELLLGLSANTAEPRTLVPGYSRLHVLALGANGRFTDRTADFVEGDVFLRSTFGAGFADDINLDGKPDIVFATHQEDGRNEDLGSLMQAYPVVLLSQPSGRHRLVSFGRPAWNTNIPTVVRNAAGEKLVVLANDGWRAYALRNGSLIEQNASPAQLDFRQLGGMFFRNFQAADGNHYVVTTAPYPDVLTLRLYRLRPDLGTELVASVPSGYQVAGTANFTTWQGSVYPVDVLTDGSDFFVGGGGYGLDQACILKGEGDESFRVLAVGAIPRILDYQPGRDPTRVEERRVAFEYAFRQGTLIARPVAIDGLDTTTNRWGTSCEDVNGDGRDDIWVSVLRDGSDRFFPLVYLNQGNGSFRRAPDASFPAVDTPFEQDNLLVLVADMDGDGISDFLTVPSKGDGMMERNTLRFFRGLRRLE